jgi:hypothetical protein
MGPPTCDVVRFRKGSTSIENTEDGLLIRRFASTGWYLFAKSWRQRIVTSFESGKTFRGLAAA